MDALTEIQIEEQLDSEVFPDKAYLTVLNNCQISIEATSEIVQFKKGEIIPIQFNPTEYSISSQSSVDSMEVPSNEKKVLRHKATGPDTFKVSFMYDAEVQLGGAFGKQKNGFKKFSEEGDLNADCLKKFRALAHLTEKGYPLYIKFVYGHFFFIGYATSVDIKCTRFHRDGRVLRAEIQLSIRQKAMKEMDTAAPEAPKQSSPEKETYLYLDDLFGPD